MVQLIGNIALFIRTCVVCACVAGALNKAIAQEDMNDYKIIHISQQIREQEIIVQNIRNLLSHSDRQKRHIYQKIEGKSQDQERIIKGLIQMNMIPRSLYMLLSSSDADDMVKVMAILTHLSKDIKHDISVFKNNKKRINISLEEQYSALEKGHYLLERLENEKKRLLKLHQERMAVSNNKDKDGQSEKVFLQNVARRAKEDVTVEGLAATLASPKTIKDVYNKPNFSIDLAKGKLLYPVVLSAGSGNDNISYIDEYRVIFYARSGSAVYSPWGGKIRFAESFLNYEKVVVIEPSRDYLIVLTGLGSLNYDVGNIVNRGDILGFLAENEESANQEPLNRTSVLSMEIRYNNKPVNLQSWFSDESR